MATQIFVNLPVKDLNRSVAFFTALGYTFNPQFTNENATCMIVSKDHIYVMLLVETFFSTFTTKAIVGGGRGRLDADRSEGPRLHVPARLPGPRRPRVGAGVHGTRRGAGLNRGGGDQSIATLPSFTSFANLVVSSAICFAI